VFKLTGELSGGEKSRLRLCILMDAEINFLALDEPTNHLDIPSREWIEDAVAGFEGTLLFVSHDRYFTEKFATRIWELEDGRFTDYRCAFEEYRALKASAASNAQPQSPTRQNARAAEKAPKRNQRASVRAANALEREIAEIERQIAEIEQSRYEHASDYMRLLELDAEQERLEAELEEKIARWETVAE
jgi:ATPase subunit of ABC transporter with duplicated ATPase domains